MSNTNSPIDLRTCVPGQKLRTREGTISVYNGSHASPFYPHEVGRNGHTCRAYTDGGRYHKDRPDHPMDIVEILPLEQPAKPIDLRTCVVGQQCRQRDGRIVKYHGRCPRSLTYVHDLRGERSNWVTCTDDGRSFKPIEQPNDIVEILPMPQATPANSPAQPATQTTPATSMKTPQEIYLEGQRIADFKPGEKVKVLFKVPSHSAGWTGSWSGQYESEFMGAPCTVHSVNNGSLGVEVKTAGARYFLLPWFCLERIKSEPVKVVLNDTWTAEVISKDEVKVGCQTFSACAIRQTLNMLDAIPVKDRALNDAYSAAWAYVQPHSIKVAGRRIPVENLRKLLAAVDAFVG